MQTSLKIKSLLLPFVAASAAFHAVDAVAAEVPAPQQPGSSVLTELIQSSSLPTVNTSLPTVSNGNGSNGNSQVTSVSQLSDVQPTDWAFQALQSLVERYGCIAGYPNRTYRGNRPLTRYEFAAGLNACMDRVNELIASATADSVKKEDLEAIKTLQEEFANELGTLRGQVDSLEVRTKTLEAQQFSTTTKLTGEVIFALAQTFGSTQATGRTGATAARNPRLDENTIFGSRVRLNFDASFTGTDRLRVRLQAANIPNFNGVSQTDETRLAFDTNSQNNFQIDDLFYRFNPTPNTRIYIAAASSEFNDFINVFNPGLDSSGSGAVSRFGRFGSIYRSGEGTGIVVTHSFLDKKLVLNAGYLAGNQSNTGGNVNAGQGAADPRSGFGLFNGNNSVLAQLEINPVKPLSIGLTYARAYQGASGLGGAAPLSSAPNLTGSLGSDLAQEPFGNVATRSNQFQVAANLRVNSRLTLTAWGTYVNAFASRSIAGVRRTDSADIWSWLGAISYKDLGRSGSNLALIFGSPSGARRISRSAADPDTAYHIEVLYRLPITDNVAITPGFFTILNPESNSRNSALYVGTIRTTFSF